MSDFLNLIQQQAHSLEETSNRGGGNNNRADFVKPAKQDLRLTKSNPAMLVRLLPNKEWLEGNINGVGYPFSELWASYTREDGTDHLGKMLFTVPMRYTETDQRGMEYLKDGRLHKRASDKYAPYIQKGAYVNAVVLQETPQGYTEVRDAQGNLDIRLFRLSNPLYTKLVNAVSEPLYRPANPTQDPNYAPFSFMSLDVAFPIKLSRTGEQTGVEYSLDVFSNIQLGALNPQEVLAGLDPNVVELTTAYEESTQELQEYMKMILDTAEKDYGNNTATASTPTSEPFADMTAKPAFAQSAQPAVPTQAPVSQPTPEINLQPQAPVQQPAQPQVAPTPVAPTPVPQTDNNPFGASMQSMQTPTPVAPQPQVEQPAQPTPAPFGNTATPFSNDKIEGLPDSLQQAVMDAVNRQ